MDPFRRLLGRGAAKKAGQVLREADEARDAGNWSAAADLYAAFLEMKPEADGIWIQRGNMLKESGRHADAMAAYRKAIALNPDSADAFLMLGHLHKVMGDLEGCEAAYRQAFILNSEDRTAFRELRALGASLDADTFAAAAAKLAGRGEQVLMDLSDIFKFLKDHATVSGIQRVQLHLSESIIRAGGDTFRLSYLDEVTRAYYTIPSQTVLDLAAALRRQPVDHGELRGIIARAEQGAEVYVPRAGDVVFVAGAFWMLPDTANIYQALKNAGVRIAVYIYDIIPITHPEFCAPELVARFSRCLFHFIRMADVIFTISEFSAVDLVRYCKERGIPLAPVRPVKLAHQLDSGESSASRASPAVRGLLERPFVLFVSTIEARKNHNYLFQIWLKLLERHPRDTVPELVFVGRPGWRVKDLMGSFASRNHLDGKLHILSNVSDADLSLLYRAARFSAFPSFVEGWGLPIGESLAFGTPCISSSTSSMPEVGGDLVDYVDPHNVTGGLALVEELIYTPGALEARRQRIARDFRAVTWPQVGDEMRARFGEVLRREAPYDGPDRGADDTVARLAPGSRILFEESALEPRIERMRELAEADFIFDDKWLWDEHQVKWLSGSRARLGLRMLDTASGQAASAQVAPGSVIPVQLDLRLKAPAAAGNTLVFRSGGAEVGRLEARAGDWLVVCGAVVGEDGIVRLDLEIEGLMPRDDRLRPILVGVTALGISAPVAAQPFLAMEQRIRLVRPKPDR
ncbi:glycosyltransferase family 4 protein [Pannonibacter tanglangensis]|uniref:Glycosyltransferase n=1 Tax=Pannonibacter tanglangensis TaxID=2750084 RepID=A0ABW9ZFD4_9HYPH|nr:glycosyltransferase [Pannonibacter sp. XCT-34]NBN62707.1 glycosyltransferase [Pannonibacter sp. XCT-34]